MKGLYTTIYFLILFAVHASSNSNLKKGGIYEKDDIEFITNFYDQNTKTQVKGTELRPDKDSSPLAMTKEQLGRYSWGILHSMAAAYPQKPTKEDRENVKTFLFSFAKLYACRICGTHFEAMLKEFPIKAGSRHDLVFYLCDLHNKVNKRLNKPIFDCDKAFDVWGGNCGCTDKKTNKA